MAQPQYNFQPLRNDSPESRDFSLFASWISIRFQKLASVLRGPSSLALTVPSAKTLQPGDVDQTVVTMTGNVTLTLDLASSRRGAWADIELVQDATGGRTVTWVNALWTSGTAPTIATAANARTLIRFIHVGDGWAGVLHAKSY